jgi:hypothetical protein
MENTKKPMLKSAMNAGALVGLGLIAFSMLLYILGLSTSQTAGYFGYAVLIAGIIISGIHYRDKENGGILKYGNALGYGVLVTLFASVILAFFTFIQLKFIDPGIIEKMLQITEEQMMQKGMPDNQVEMAMNMTRKMMQPEIAPIFVVLAYVFFGFIFSLITSAIIKKEGNPFQQAMGEIKDEQKTEGQ